VSCLNGTPIANLGHVATGEEHPKDERWWTTIRRCVRTERDAVRSGNGGSLTQIKLTQWSRALFQRMFLFFFRQELRD